MFMVIAMGVIILMDHAPPPPPPPSPCSFKTDSLLFDFFGLMYFLATLGMVVSCQKNSDYRMFAVNYAIVTAVHAL